MYPHRAKVKKKRRGARNGFWLLFTLFVVLGLGALYLASPLALIADVTVIGTDNLEAESLIMQSSIREGEHFWRINLGQARKDLLSNYWLQSVQIKRQFPNSILIEVTEQRPLALIADSESSSEYIVSKTGLILSENSGFSLPYITGHEIRVDAGVDLSLHDSVTAALRSIESLLLIETELSEVNIEHYPVNLQLFTTDGYRILASPHQLDDRVNDLLAMLAQLRRQALRGTIDLRGKQGVVSFTPYETTEPDDSLPDPESESEQIPEPDADNDNF
ncbi:MAG: FtsQ-type POTRA domain-containing protein [Firmicutes bacterium]|nr:FtsQ-type POTRA domain-containing protein [Bacillota bacterium]